MQREQRFLCAFGIFSIIGGTRDLSGAPTELSRLANFSTGAPDRSFHRILRRYNSTICLTSTKIGGICVPVVGGRLTVAQRAGLDVTGGKPRKRLHCNKPFEPQRTQRNTGETYAFIRVHQWLEDLFAVDAEKKYPYGEADVRLFRKIERLIEPIPPIGKP